MSEHVAPTVPAPTRSRMRTRALGIALALGVIALDQGTKALALANLSETERIPLLGDWFGLQLAFNTGASFSLGSESTLLISILGIVVSIGLVVAIWRTSSAIWAAGFGLVLGGAVGNIIDRFVAAPGWGRGPVTDFLAYGSLFIGNVADVIIGVGIGVMAIAVLRRPAKADAVAEAAPSTPAGGEPRD